jgi:hypothetical protein
MKPSPFHSRPITPADPTSSPSGIAWGRSSYQGTNHPRIAEPTKSAKLASYQRHGSGLFAVIVDAGTHHRLYLAHVGHPELMRLGDCDRATLQGALAAIRREVGNV